MERTIDVEKLYKFAYKIARDQAKELAHHCIANTDLSNVKKDPHSYLYTVMMNEYRNKNSTFNKNKSSQVIPFYSEDSIIRYDINKLHTILFELEQKGFKNEVAIFKEVKFVSDMRKVARKNGYSLFRVRKAVKTITDEIIKRYPRN